ncbi:hypothetical protein FO519_003732 [Halicephalobus sp. NKZ332]|nr:hypothetical protein FO519_003732 [Halicephalobus sp. NKZ332]
MWIHRISLILLIPAISATCPTIFYAKSVSYEKVKSIDFYQTRAAVYNFLSKKCVLSYDLPIDCKNQKERYNTFFLENNYQSPLIIISCIDRCRKGEKIKSLQELFNLEPVSQEIKKKEKPELITGPPEPDNTVDTVITEEKSKGNMTVKMNPKPLSIEIFEENRKVKKINGTIKEEKSGKFIAIKPPEGSKVQLITLSPEEFSKISGDGKRLETITGRFDVKDGNLADIIETVRQQLQNIEKSKSSGNQENPGETKIAASESEEVLTEGVPTLSPGTTTVPSELLKTVLEPIVVNGKILSSSEVAKLSEKESTVTPQEVLEVLKILKATTDPVVINGKVFSAAELEKLIEQLNKMSSEATTVSPRTTTVPLEILEPIVINGKVLSPPETNKIEEEESTVVPESTTASLKLPKTTTEPIVVNGRVLSPSERKKLAEYERTTTTTTTTPRPLVLTTEPPYYENTFLITGVDDMFKEALIDRNRKGQGHLSTEFSTDAMASSPAVCFRIIPQQNLMRADFRKLPGRSSLTECRCACAKTWAVESDPKCKSLQFDEVSGECVLNKDDHEGKFDLVFNRSMDYHYITCDLSGLLDLAENICSENEKTQKIKENSSNILKPDSVSSNSTPAPEKKIFEGDSSEIVTDSPTMPETKVIQGIDRTFHYINDRNSHNENYIDNRVSEGNNKNRNINYINNESYNDINYTIYHVHNRIFDDIYHIYNRSPNDNQGSEGPRTSNYNYRNHYNHGNYYYVDNGSSIDNDKIEIRQRRQEENKASEGKDYDPEDNSMAEIRFSKRYAFQCLSANYYPSERDCILNLDNRHLHPEFFVKSNADTNVTYLGMTCPLKKSIEVLVNPEFEAGCLKPLSSTPPILTTVETTVNTDECFLEIQNHVLEGDYLGVETNVSIEECKCLCIDAENRYGSICQSIQYHYDRQTCLLNKESRFTDRESFIEDPYQDNMSSYFDFRCSGERIALSLYVEEVCTKVVDIDLKSLGLDEIKPPALRPDDAENNSDEASIEVKKDPEMVSEIVDNEEVSGESFYNNRVEEEETEVTKKKKQKTTEVPTTEAPTTTTTDYKPVGQCRYSALYQTIFNGSRLLKRLMVNSAPQCFAACHAEKCRSANLIQVEGTLKTCELYKDSIIDFRRTDVLVFDSSAVHFDSIQCDEA